MTLKLLFGKRLKELRESLFMTQEFLAEKIGVHRNTLARIEKGESFATAETIERIKTALNVEFSDLFTFNHIKKKDKLKAFKLKLEELNEIDTEYFLNNINAYLAMKKQIKNKK